MVNYQKPVKMKFKIAFGKGGIEPEGTVQDLIILVKDELAVYRFERAETTKKFVKSQIASGVKSLYNERIQSCICKYEGFKQKDLVNHISNRIKSLEKSK